jgi:riboflavin kinase/FMN adenylyltransferase
MIVLRDGEIDAGASQASVVTIGVFDGLHRGHQAIISELVALAASDDARATVVTFDPLPAMVLAPERAPRLLMTIEQRLEGLAALGVQVVRVLTFNEALQHEAARHFIQRVLVDELRTRCVIVGEDFHFGHRREGSVATLREMGAEIGFDVVAPGLFGDTERWSSTAVRRSLAAGDLTGVQRILGRPFSLRGTVVHGDERGEELGFPTANLKLSPYQALPDEGVYAGATRLGDVWWPCALSLGTRPQFYENGELLVEAHVLGFEGNLYDSNIEVVFLSRLRAQETFQSVAELTAQIERDVKKTREIFEEYSHNDAKLLT